MNNHLHQNDGPALAAIVAAGVGSAVIGLATVLAEVNPMTGEALNWWPPAGPLTGKTGIGVIAWLASWGLLHLLWKQKELPFVKVSFWAIVLIFVGWAGTFPPLFKAFGEH